MNYGVRKVKVIRAESSGFPSVDQQNALVLHGGHVAMDAAANQKLVVIQPRGRRAQSELIGTTERTTASISCSGFR